MANTAGEALLNLSKSLGVAATRLPPPGDLHVPLRGPRALFAEPMLRLCKSQLRLPSIATAPAISIRECAELSSVDRVRIVTGPDQGNAAVVLTAAELHPDCLVLNYISQLDRDELEQGMIDGQPKRFDVTDDVGTEYEVVGGSGGGEGDVRRMDVKLRPAVPGDAKSLRIAMGIGAVVFTL